MKKVFIVILNYNGEGFILDCLESVKKLTSENFKLEIVVVDNGSTDNSVKLIKRKFPKVRLIENKENLGFCKGNNIGIEYAIKKKADYIMLLNNDTIVDSNLVVNLLAGFKDGVGIVSPKIYFASGYEFHKKRYKPGERGKVIWYGGGRIDWENVLLSHCNVDEVDRGQFDKARETDFATGCCMMVKSEVFEKIGLFNEKYFLYYEDADFSMRVRRAGLKIIFYPKGKLWHLNAGSIGGSGSSLQDYYLTRNRLFFGMKYGRFKVKLSLLKEAFLLLFKGEGHRKRAVIDFLVGRFGRKD